MNKDQLAYGIGGVLIGALVVWLLVSNGGTPQYVGMMNNNRSAQDMMGTVQDIDAHFIEHMIPHHEDAITMAELALTKAKHPEIKQLSQDIIQSQSKEINQMKEWYQDWYGRELPTGDQVMQHHGMRSGSGMHMGMMGNENDMARFEEAADFDKAFIEHMIPHHQMAVMMASMLQRGTQRSEMEQLAEDIISAQTREIDQMREWYGAWF